MDIFVGNLSFEATESDVIKLFGDFGVVTSAVIVKEKKGDKSRGFGFVTMADEQSGQLAIAALNGREFMGRALNVSPARPKTEEERIEKREHAESLKRESHVDAYGERARRDAGFSPSPHERSGYKGGRRSRSFMRRAAEKGVVEGFKPRKTFHDNPGRWRKKSDLRPWKKNDGDVAPVRAEEGSARPWRKSEGEARPWKKFSGGSRPWKAGAGESQPWKKRAGEEGKPWKRDEGSSARPWKKVEGEARPWRKSEGEARPWKKFSGGSRPWKAGAGESQPWKKRAGEEGKPWKRDEGSSARPWKKVEGEARPWRKSEGEARPWKKFSGGSRPWKAGAGDSKPWKKPEGQIKPWKKSEGSAKPWHAKSDHPRKSGFKGRPKPGGFKR